jgi:hypothetical protein
MLPNKQLDMNEKGDDDDDGSPTSQHPVNREKWEMQPTTPGRLPFTPGLPTPSLASPFTPGHNSPFTPGGQASPFTPGNQTSPFTPRTQAFNTLDRRLPLRYG